MGFSMNQIAMKPILFSSQGVAFEIRCQLVLNPELLDGAGESQIRLRRMAKQQIEPSPKVLTFLQYTKQEGGYEWQPR